MYIRVVNYKALLRRIAEVIWDSWKKDRSRNQKSVPGSVLIY